ncbi:MAG: sulfatase-like hydrolase/transferase, partial [Pseudomonadota bacterium]|nr:sulfatase-like hydrolase/transferase [Pseudomonadota bacterium]
MNMFCKPILGTGLAPAFVFIVLLSLPAVQVSAAEAISRPNIIVIMADDLDTASLRAALELQSPEFPDGLMPHLKRFVVEPGVEFAESFVTFPLCCPSRATYLTGLYPHNHNVLGNLPPAGGFYRFDDTSTIATWLLAGGYRTGHIGKYLNGYQDATYVPPGWSDWYSLVGPTTYCMYDYTISSNGVPQYYHDAEEDYQTDVLAAYAEGFIHDVDSFDDIQPFFLSVTPLAPHLESYCNYNDIRAAPR